MKKSLLLLDCTLRDGGYYNNWDFPQEVVEAYLKAVADAGINYVELGLRNFPKNGFLGAYAYTTEQHLNTLDLPEGPIYGVMVDAKTILSADMDPVAAVDALFVPRSESKVDLVRIAAHFHEVEHSASMVARLKELGYIVGYNLMQSGGKPSELIAEKARIATSWGDNLDVLYFADSLGNMDETEVERIIKAIRTEWTGTMGIHTHDNMSKGLDNSLTAKNNGVEWLDATITGMGRGAGNTQTERLLAVIAQEHGYNAQPVYDLVVRHFEKMQKDYGWGTNLLYFLGAQNDVHPTYIQNLLTSNFYGTDEIISAISYLSKLDNSQSYDGLILENAINSKNNNNTITGSYDLKSLFKNKEVLLLSNGPNTQKYKSAIELYIKEKSPIVLSVNINDYINEELIDYYVISHNVKLITDFDKYKKLQSKIILPKHRFDNDELSELQELSILDYGFEVNESHFEVHDNYVTSPYDITISYCLGIVTAGHCESVRLVGFDGFDKHDDRQIQMLDLLNHYNKNPNRPKLIALTPTTYTITQSSIYAIH
ncbi:MULTISPECIES: aldolase catalytic domain-containing protein [unclassified Vibrio]|uniref:Aldolase catalytic domain-containing protein n=1 Tax=Vibrio sp. HB236076 TaxID=3232307 RepID=A0AB39HFZ7_9VIBR|nr:aldolase catalytic domain-containing protein [Vibrio sp. HB161653]MDP5254340.1 aldolase catalytic domain-containing protein [Vibrio sp. HB161653]